MPKSQLALHEQVKCKKASARCTYCKAKVKLTNLQNHEKQRCPMRRVKCTKEWECKWEGLVSQYKNHKCLNNVILPPVVTVVDSILGKRSFNSFMSGEVVDLTDDTDDIEIIEIDKVPRLV
jgi:NifB/MoaA-like Fe-S oxidoreductase